MPSKQRRLLNSSFHLVSVNTESGEHIIEHNLSVCDVIIARGPVTGVVHIVTAPVHCSARLITRLPTIETGVTHLTQGSSAGGHVPTVPGPGGVLNIIHTLQSNIDESLFILISNLELKMMIDKNFTGKCIKLVG